MHTAFEHFMLHSQYIEREAQFRKLQMLLYSGNTIISYTRGVNLSPVIGVILVIYTTRLAPLSETTNLTMTYRY
jgi:hypothetical protein